ncbi:FAD-binding oxidoreductase [Candidatus Saccharibacteria bacterium]|nr:FAD-binding oxidoreductase [Candidatus Saccharibacteria bacterium]
MNKIAHYLQEHLLGEVSSAAEVRRHFSHDGSILRLTPTAVAYPRNETDIRKTVRFAWQLAQRGRVLPITARGGGTDSSGAAVGGGIILVFAAHMNNILFFNPKRRFISVEPGITYEVLEQVLRSHGLFLPPYPLSQMRATVGGGIANNAIGEKSVKYGATADYVDSLRIVLSNGEVIETGPLGKKELNHKLGLQTFEGEIYRTLDALLEENADLINTGREQIKARHNSAGYNLFDVRKKGEFNLTPLFIGSQGTLGIITEATLEVVKHNSKTTLAIISLNELNDLLVVLPNILELQPSLLDMLNQAAVEQIQQINPSQLTGVLAQPKAAVHLFVEFDNRKEKDRHKAVKQLQKIADQVEAWTEVFDKTEGQDRFWKILGSINTLLVNPHGQAKAVPVMEAVSVPVNRLVEFLHQAYKSFDETGLAAAAWGHAGDGVMRLQPMLDLAQLGDRQKLFKIADSIYDSAIQLGGSTNAGSGDGRIRAPYLSKMYGQELRDLMIRIKKIFDPHGFLNPGVKTASAEDIKTLLRSEYNLSNFYDYLPRT